MRRFREWLQQGRPVLGAALLLLSLTSIAMLMIEGAGPPGKANVPTFRGADKLLHFGAHFWVAGLMYWGLVLQRHPANPRKRALWAAIAVLLIDATAGIGIEFVQLSVGGPHGRVFDWLDVAANIAGAAAGVAISYAGMALGNSQ